MARRYSMTKRAQAIEGTRQRLMTAAMDLVMETGGANVPMTAIAERADVSVRTAYNHFASVDALLTAAMAAINEQFASLAPAPVTDHRSPEGALREFVRRWFQEMARQEDRLAALVMIRDAPELERALTTAREIRLERVRSVLAIAQESGRLRAPLDEAAAVAFVQTSYQSWVALVRQLGLSSEEAADLVSRSVAAFAFHHPSWPARR
ncbi:TetR/AcrR family transcriptional regulator [Nonomuraea terrae]|uniref:TetR/AcrR family transcriptional regulator n=1 Tax=Nonomuraea terrae TaxID=2530383 RepID=A0A4R4Z330_9ACTN|nr:TetR/AcrR family transcriptional regulator [Nonomuraea terrae]TDD51820.1 TetR/AcrR family transcriptional regulator [Nonomuraea terrae]